MTRLGQVGDHALLQTPARECTVTNMLVSTLAYVRLPRDGLTTTVSAVREENIRHHLSVVRVALRQRSIAGRGPSSRLGQNVFRLFENHAGDGSVA